MLKYKAIVFDVSDTLIEYSPNYAKIFGDRLRSLSFEVSEEKAQEISKMINWTIGEQNRRECHGAPHLLEFELNKLLDSAALRCITDESNNSQEYLSKLNKILMPKQEINVISDAFSVLNIIKSKYRLAIVSNHYTWLMDYLDKINLVSYFEAIVISENVGVSKPDIRIMQIVLNELELEAKDCLYVGDQPMDVLCSKEIGMDCAWIADNEYVLPETIPFKEDYRISRLTDLLNIL
jgi:HAD superfamily hydrolase (TIGR01549 family)